MHLFTLPYLLLLASPCVGFLPDFWSRVLTLSWDSHTHQYITERAILNVTLETLRGLKNTMETMIKRRRIAFHSNNDKSPGLTTAEQTGPWILESCGRGGEIQCSHGLPELHKV